MVYSVGDSCTMNVNNKAYLEDRERYGKKDGKTCVLKDTNGSAVLQSLSTRSCGPDPTFGWMGIQKCSAWSTNKYLYCPGDYIGKGKVCKTDKMNVTTGIVGEDGYQHSGPINQRNRPRTNEKSFGDFSVRCPDNMFLMATPLGKEGNSMKYKFYCKT